MCSALTNSKLSNAKSFKSVAPSLDQKNTSFEILFESIVGPYSVNKDDEDNEKRDVDNGLYNKVVHELDFLHVIEYSFPERSEDEDREADGGANHQ